MKKGLFNQKMAGNNEGDFANGQVEGHEVELQSKKLLVWGPKQGFSVKNSSLQARRLFSKPEKKRSLSWIDN